MNPPYVVLAAIKHEKNHPGEYAISVRCRPGEDEAALASRIIGPVYMVSLIGRLRSKGYDVVASEIEPGDAHADLVLPRKPAEEDVEALKEEFERKSKDNG